ncbi:MAG TPA: hypothetical protein VIK59_08370 [Verrucomicrobiae bacterium]
MEILDLLKALGFKRAANYVKTADGKIQCQRNHEWKGKKATRGAKVYCLIEICGSIKKVLYVGETIQAARMFQYRSNKAMAKVYKELSKKPKSNCKVEVWVCIDFENVHLALAKHPLTIGRLGLEGILIEHFDPDWNRKKRVKKTNAVK